MTLKNDNPNFEPIKFEHNKFGLSLELFFNIKISVSM